MTRTVFSKNGLVSVDYSEAVLGSKSPQQQRRVIYEQNLILRDMSCLVFLKTRDACGCLQKGSAFNRF